MNINLIDLLKQKVSAVVLEGETEHLSEKSQALSSFTRYYCLFLNLNLN